MANVPRLLRLSYDLEPVVAALLPSFKSQSRIVNPDDDAFATEVLGRAINFVEIRSAIAIASQSYSWVPMLPNQLWSWPRAPVPVRGVTDFTADRSGVDVTAEYWLDGASVDIYGPQYLEREGGLYAGDVVTLVAGFPEDWAAPAPLPLAPALADVIVRYAAYLWEFREAATLGQASNLAPDWFNESMAIFWIPRC